MVYTEGSFERQDRIREAYQEQETKLPKGLGQQVALELERMEQI